MKFRTTLLAACLCAGASVVNAMAPADQAARLGKDLTPFGAEQAANAAGTIPAWTGGLTTPPAGFDPKSGMRPDPFAAEQPYLVISKANMAEHADKLSEGSRALLEKYGDEGFRIKVWPTHRTFAAPKWYYDNTLANAATVTAGGDGLKLENIKPGTPFPVPQNGLEAIWNHLLRYEGSHLEGTYQAVYVDSSGKRILATVGEATIEYPFYNPGKDYDSGFNDYYMIRIDYTQPARRAGEKLLVIDPMDFTNGSGRRAWQYLKGQRRVRRAPSVAYDTPNPGTAGQTTYDDAFVFNGAPDRYDWKLVGKKEMYIPYNSYKLAYETTSDEKYGAHFINPDVNRWELHRVWVVEATLKSGMRHLYAKRRFYIDEDSWAAVTSDQYDGQGNLWRVGFGYQVPMYEMPAGSILLQGSYDLLSKVYAMQGDSAEYGGMHTDRESKPTNYWTGQGLSASGVR
jgi:hypothetical protein